MYLSYRTTAPGQAIMIPPAGGTGQKCSPCPVPPAFLPHRPAALPLTNGECNSNMNKNLYLLLLPVLLAGQTQANDDPQPCGTGYQPTLPGYDFSANRDRWAQNDQDYGLPDNARVGHLYVNSLPIFNPDDPRENNPLYMLVNRLKAATQPGVVEDLVLFHEGDPISNDLAAESERILRSKKYTNDAAVRLVSTCDNIVDVEVLTKEVWTLVPDFKLSRKGGQTEAGIGFHDSDILGTGSKLVISYTSEQERNGFLLDYLDDNFRGNRVNLLAHLEENSDGFVRQGEVSLPFYALDATKTWGVSAGESQKYIHQYQSGESVSQVGLEDERVEMWLGASRGLVNGYARRWQWGLVAERMRYKSVPNIAMPPTRPEDIDLLYPYLQYQSIENEFGVAYNLNQIHRSEDIHLGRSFTARFGLSPIEDTRLVYEGRFSDTLSSRDRKLLQAYVDWSGRWNINRNAVEDSIVSLGVDYHRGQTDNRSLFLGLKYVNSWNLSPEKQVILGGATGLRGYPTHYASGATSVVLTAEERLFTDWSLLRLFNVGMVAFTDVGRAHYRGGSNYEDLGWLADAGVGLRLVPSKSDPSRVIHIDVAWPKDTIDGKSGPQFTVEVRKSL